MKHTWQQLTLSALLLATGLPRVAAPDSPQPVTLLTGGKGGYYQSVGEALRRFAEKRLNIKIVVKESSGSMENLECLSASLQKRRAQKKEGARSPSPVEKSPCEFALVQSDAAHRALYGEPPFSKGEKGDLVLVVPLFAEKVHILVRPHFFLSDPKELGDKTIWLGQADSGSEISALNVLRASGLSEDKVDKIKLSSRKMGLEFNRAVACLKDPRGDGCVIQRRRLDAIFQTSVAPTGRIAKHLKDAEIHLVGLKWDQVEKLVADGTYLETSLQKADYPQVTTGIYTVGVQAFLMTHSEMDPEVVRRLATSLESESGRKDFESELQNVLIRNVITSELTVKVFRILRNEELRHILPEADWETKLKKFFTEKKVDRDLQAFLMTNGFLTALRDDLRKEAEARQQLQNIARKRESIGELKTSLGDQEEFDEELETISKKRDLQKFLERRKQFHAEMQVAPRTPEAEFAAKWESVFQEQSDSDAELQTILRRGVRMADVQTFLQKRRQFAGRLQSILEAKQKRLDAQGLSISKKPGDIYAQFQKTLQEADLKEKLPKLWTELESNAEVTEPWRMNLLGTKPKDQLRSFFSRSIEEDLFKLPRVRPETREELVWLTVLLGGLAFVGWAWPWSRNKVKDHLRGVVSLLVAVIVALIGAVWLQAVEGDLDEHFASLAASFKSLTLSVFAQLGTRLGLSLPGEIHTPTTTTGQLIAGVFVALVAVPLSFIVLPSLARLAGIIKEAKDTGDEPSATWRRPGLILILNWDGRWEQRLRELDSSGDGEVVVVSKMSSRPLLDNYFLHVTTQVGDPSLRKTIEDARVWKAQSVTIVSAWQAEQSSERRKTLAWKRPRTWELRRELDPELADSKTIQTIREIRALCAEQSPPRDVPIIAEIRDEKNVEKAKAAADHKNINIMRPCPSSSVVPAESATLENHT